MIIKGYLYTKIKKSLGENKIEEKLPLSPNILYGILIQDVSEKKL